MKYLIALFTIVAASGCASSTQTKAMPKSERTPSSVRFSPLSCADKKSINTNMVSEICFGKILPNTANSQREEYAFAIREYNGSPVLSDFILMHYIVYEEDFPKGRGKFKFVAADATRRTSLFIEGEALMEADRWVSHLTYRTDRHRMANVPFVDVPMKRVQ